MILAKEKSSCLSYLTRYLFPRHVCTTVQIPQKKSSLIHKNMKS